MTSTPAFLPMVFQSETMDLINWSKKVANPEAFGDAEKELWSKIEPVLNEVLDELKSRNKIETEFKNSEVRYLLACIQKLDDFSLVHNFLLHLTDSKEKADNFLKTNAEFGLDEPRIMANYVNAVFTMSVLNTELFKLVLLFHLRGVNPKVSNFHATMKAAAPSSWSKLESFIDSSFRNALAHGAYAIINQKVILFENAKLQPIEQLELGECMIRGKTQGVLFQCLINVLRDKGEQGFFTP